MVLENMIYRMRNEIQFTRDDFAARTKRLEKIKKLSASQKVDLLQYYNEIEGLCAKIDRAKTISGDISKDLQNISKSCQGQDDLVKAISEDLLRSPHTSTNVVSNKMVKDYFIEQRDSYYWDWFQRKENAMVNIFGRTVYYAYTYMFLDKFMFQKKYAMAHVLKDDSTVWRDIRLLNYIEEALNNGNIEEAHVFATQMSPKMKRDLKLLIEMWEDHIKLNISLETLKDHSSNLISTTFGN